MTVVPKKPQSFTDFTHRRHPAGAASTVEVEQMKAMNRSTATTFIMLVLSQTL